MMRILLILSFRPRRIAFFSLGGQRLRTFGTGMWASRHRLPRHPKPILYIPPEKQFRVESFSDMLFICAGAGDITDVQSEAALRWQSCWW
jgi:hypothetical protein